MSACPTCGRESQVIFTCETGQYCFPCMRTHVAAWHNHPPDTACATCRRTDGPLIHYDGLWRCPGCLALYQGEDDDVDQ